VALVFSVRCSEAVRALVRSRQGSRGTTWRRIRSPSCF